MDYLIAAQTDIGISKQTNQDSYCIKKAESKKFGKILFAIVCDGMGGLSKGELASATVVKEFSNWFDNYFPALLENNSVNFNNIKNEWVRLIKKLNSKIGNYGVEHSFSLGTTLVSALCIGDRIFVANVGDSRLYKINKNVSRLTNDQSLVAREIASGNLSPEQEESDSRRNVLLQCIGASQILNPEIEEYTIEKNCIYILCSDGFRHEIKENEMLGLLSPNIIKNEDVLNSTLLDIIKLLKERNENDNITAVSFKIIE